MIELSFDIPVSGAPWRDTWDRVDSVNPATISETDLCYKYFAVSLRFAIGDVEIVSKSRGVTLVDFALSLQYALKRVASGKDASIGFTENDEVVRLQAENHAFMVTSSKREWRVAVDRNEMLDAFAAFIEEAYSSLVERAPGLAENPVIRDLHWGDKS